MVDQKSNLWLALLGYSAFFLFAFIFFAYLSFPYERLRDYLVAQAAAQGGKDSAKLRIGELSPAPLLGLTLQDVSFTRSAAGPDEAPQVIELDELTLKTSLMSVLLGDSTVEFSGSAGLGSFNGTFEQVEGTKQVHAELERLDLESIGLGAQLGLPIEGRATGKVELHLPEDLSKSDGDINLKVNKLALGDGKAQVKAPGMREGFTVERIDAGKLDFQAAIKQGTVNLKTFKADGPDLTFNGSGNIQLMSPAMRSRVNLALEFNFSEAYKNRDDKTKALFELMGFRPEMQRAQTADGGFRFELKGLLASPRGVPAGKSR